MPANPETTPANDDLTTLQQELVAERKTTFAMVGEIEAAHKEARRLRKALIEIERLSPKPGGVGQIARDTLRMGA